jgi:hypothetical protein
MLKVALQFVNKVSHDAVRGALKWFIIGVDIARKIILQYIAIFYGILR